MTQLELEVKDGKIIFPQYDDDFTFFSLNTKEEMIRRSRAYGRHLTGGPCPDNLKNAIEIFNAYKPYLAYVFEKNSRGNTIINFHGYKSAIRTAERGRGCAIEQYINMILFSQGILTATRKDSWSFSDKDMNPPWGFSDKEFTTYYYGRLYFKRKKEICAYAEAYRMTYPDWEIIKVSEVIQKEEII